MERLLPMDEDYYLWLLLVQTRRAVLKVREKELRRYDIRAPQSGVLFAIQLTGDGATPGQIARLLFREHHTVWELLGRMANHGLVRKVKDLDRKNLVRVVLTEKGRQAYYQSLKRESIHKVFSSLSGEQRRQLRSCLETLRHKALEELSLAKKMPLPPAA